MSIYLSSDHHFYHKNIILYDQRPFSSVEEMNQVMMDRWNETVKPEDTVLYLGDFSLSKLALTEILPKLNGEKHLVAGNHDHCHPAHAKKPEKIARMTQLYLDSGFKSVTLEDEIIIGLEKVKLHHMPYSGDHGELREKYFQYRPKNNGEWLIHGHVHCAWKQKGRMINVGVCHWDYAPVSIDEIQKMIENGENNI